MNQIKIVDLLAHFPECIFYGDKTTELQNIVGLSDAIDVPCKNDIAWLSDTKGEALTSKQLNLGLLVLTQKMYLKLGEAKCNFLVTENPRAVFTKILSIYFKKSWPHRIEPTAVINPTSKVGLNCYIGHHVVIEDNCSIGDNTVILHNSVILANSQIGNNVIIGSNNTIGNYGFGYEKDENGEYQLLQHLGKVIIHDNVEIHNNTCVDRGVLSDTVIHENVKIDNLVHIAHGVTIEKNALIIANAMIGGSAIIGESSWIAPSVSIKNQIKIAPNTMTGIGAVVLKGTQEKSVMIGNPAITMEEYKKWSEIKKKLEE
ncbi:MAG: hypothetical protein JSS79_12000 [Bacteroidetes bacterium]|nr:hypothetical protein [Bacteroidota bacterium]